MSPLNKKQTYDSETLSRMDKIAQKGLAFDKKMVNKIAVERAKDDIINQRGEMKWTLGKSFSKQNIMNLTSMGHGPQ